MAFLSQLDPADIRMRVFYSRRSIERSELARLTQIDYAREMAFVAVEPGPDGAGAHAGRGAGHRRPGQRQRRVRHRHPLGHEGPAPGPAADAAHHRLPARPAARRSWWPPCWPKTRACWSWRAGWASSRSPATRATASATSSWRSERRPRRPSSPNSVRKDAGLQPLLAQPAHHHRLVAVGDDDALGAGGADGRLQARPVGMVAEHEAAVHALAAARAAQLHPAAGEGIAEVAEAPRPGAAVHRRRGDDQRARPGFARRRPAAAGRHGASATPAAR